jgi:chromate transporter
MAEGPSGMEASVNAGPPLSPQLPYSLPALLSYFLRLGTFGFGGPIALAGHMQRDLVEERGWIEQRDYDEGLALAQLSPGPLAAQLAIYLGWVRGKVMGAMLVSFAFVGPSFVMVMALSALYVRFGGLPWMQGAFYGVGAAVIGIIARSATNLGKKTLKHDKLLWTIALLNTAVTALTEKEAVWLVVAGGLSSLLLRGRFSGATLGVIPLALAWVSGLHGPASHATLLKVLSYFAGAGLFVFGSGLAIVPFLHGGLVVDQAWLTEQQFLDAVAVAMITPGPVVITVAFIGYLVAGPAGAALAAIGVFVPCFVIVLLAAPHYRKLASQGRIKHFVEGVTAGAVGAIAGSVIVLGRRSLVDLITLLIGLAAFALLGRRRKVPEPVLIAVAGSIGVLLPYLRG